MLSLANETAGTAINTTDVIYDQMTQSEGYSVHEHGSHINSAVVGIRAEIVKKVESES